VEVAYDELPAWMRSPRRVLDWPLVAVALLVAALAAPLVAGSLPWSAGLRSEVARALEISESIEAGILYPRWAGDFNLGYGSPLWNFVPPLPHYLAGLHRVLAQTSAEFSVRVTLTGALMLLGLALFGFAHRRWGRYGGMLAAALGLFSPQVALIKPLLDGDLGALLAGGFWLASLWALDRLLSVGRGVHLLLAAGACAAVWLAHQPLNAVFSGLTLAWLLFRLVTGQRADASRDALLAYALGFAASAFYWLPAWAERDTVRWQPVAGSEVVTRGSVAFRDLFGGVQAIDRAAINPDPGPVLGVAVWGTAALTLALIVASWLGKWRGDAADSDWRLLRVADREALFFGISGVLLLVAALPPLGDAWTGAGGWAPFGPADLVFPAGLCLALLAASLGARLEFHCSPRRAGLGMLALAAAIAIASVSGLVTPRAPSPAPELTLSSLVESEARGVPLVGHEPGWLLPRGVASLPPVETSFAASYASGIVDKVVRDKLPATLLADTIEHTAHTERIMLRSASPAEITLRTFLFDGWRAELDGRPLTLHTTEPGSLIGFHVPEGRHELVVTFGSTAARTMGWVLSAAACVLLLGLTVRQELQPARPADDAAAAPSQMPDARVERMVLVGWVILLGGAALIGRLQPDWVSHQSPAGTISPRSTPLLRRFQGGVDLLAYNLIPPADSADLLTLTLYWRAWRPDLPDYQVDVHLVGEDAPSQVYSLARRRHPGQIPTSEWPRWPLHNHYVIDSYTLAIPADVPPGHYQVAVQLGRCTQLDPAPCSVVTPVFVDSDSLVHLEQFAVLPDVIAVR